MSELHYFISDVTDFFKFSDNGCQTLEENLIKFLCSSQINSCRHDTLLSLIYIISIFHHFLNSIEPIQH